MPADPPRRPLLAVSESETSMNAIRIGFTGHQTMSPATRSAIRTQLCREINSREEVVGLSSLAAGADQIFADTILKTGNQLEAVIPSAKYETAFGDSAERFEYQRLLHQATYVITLAFDEPTEQAFYAAGRDVVERSQVLLAVWDGKPSAGLGGTADIVTYAHTLGREVVVIWPTGSSRK